MPTSARSSSRSGARRRTTPRRESTARRSTRRTATSSRSSSRRRRTAASTRTAATPPEGRTRFLVEIVEEIRSRCGPDFPVGVRLSADEHTPGGLTLDDTLEIVDALQETAPVDYLSITTGQRGGYVKDSSWDEGFALGLSRGRQAARRRPGDRRRPHPAARPRRAGARGGPGRLRRRRPRPARRPASGSRRRATGRADRIRPCVGIVQDCRRYAGGVTCTINPRLGREAEWPALDGKGARAARVVVAGGGPAGLEAARVAAEAGHSVVLFERESVVGGQLRQAAAGPTREELLDFVFYLERELDRLGVDVRLGAAATAADVVAEEPDLVVCATGATPEPPAFAGRGRRPRRHRVGSARRARGRDPGARARRRRRRRLLARDQRGRVPGGAGSERRARDARPGGGARDPRGERRERPSPASLERRPLPRPLARHRRRRHDRAPCGRRHRASRPRRRPTSSSWCTSLRVEDGLVAELDGSRSGTRRDRRLRRSTPSQPRRARGQSRAPPVPRGTARSRVAGALLMSVDLSRTEERERRVLADGRDAGPGHRDRALRPAVRGVGLGRPGGRRGARAAARSVRRAEPGGGGNDDDQGGHGRRGAAPGSAARGERDGDAARSLGRPRELLARPRRRRDEGAAARPAEGRRVRRVRARRAGVPAPRGRRARRGRDVDVADRRLRPVARAPAAAAEHRRDRAADDRGGGALGRRGQLLGRRRRRAAAKRDRARATRRARRSAGIPPR